MKQTLPNLRVLKLSDGSEWLSVTELRLTLLSLQQQSPPGAVNASLGALASYIGAVRADVQDNHLGDLLHHPDGRLEHLPVAG